MGGNPGSNPGGRDGVGIAVPPSVLFLGSLLGHWLEQEGTADNRGLVLSDAVCNLM